MDEGNPDLMREPTPDDFDEALEDFEGNPPLGPGSGSDFIDPDGPPLVSTGVSADCESVAPSLDNVLLALTQALEAEAPAVRPFVRYVSVAAEVHEECGDVGRTAVDRVGVSHLLNSFSLAPSIVRPRAVDEDQLLMRIDLRDYGWFRRVDIGGETYPDLWEAIVAGAQQATRLSGPEAEQLRSGTGSAVPLLLSGDFIRSATRAEIYYAALQLPSTLQEVLQQRGVPEDGDLRSGWVAAGTTSSVVSRQDRRFARSLQEAPNAEYPARLWLGLDRAPESTLPSIFLEPFSLEADAFVALFALENGLPAFFAADASGQRTPTASVLFDSTQNDFVARVPVSCVSCHVAEVLPVEDVVRPFYEADPAGAFSEEQVAAVQDAYPRDRELTRWTRADSRAMGRAASQAGVGRGSRRSPPAAFPSAWLRGERDVFPEEAAAELFVSPSVLEQHLDDLPPDLRRAVRTKQTVERVRFRREYVAALCALTRDSRNQPESCPDSEE